MRKDTTKKFLMRENRYANRMTSLEIVDFLSRKKKKIACDMIDFINVFGSKETNSNTKNILESGDKTREWVLKDRKIVEFNMAYCENGSFMRMGNIHFGDNQRIENIESSFLLGETEVTQELYELMMEKNPSKFQDTSKYPNAPKHPVENVSWYDAIRFCNALSKSKGLQECYTKISNKVWECDFSKNGFRLPREKEWEYAAKAGVDNQWAGTNYPNKADEYAWFDENSNKSTQPIATKKPNEWGFYDMSGNVHEWCWKFESAKERVFRGGSYGHSKQFVSLNSKGIDNADVKRSDIGFRICRTI